MGTIGNEYTRMEIKHKNVRIVCCKMRPTRTTKLFAKIVIWRVLVKKLEGRFFLAIIGEESWFIRYVAKANAYSQYYLGASKVSPISTIQKYLRSINPFCLCVCDHVTL